MTMFYDQVVKDAVEQICENFDIGGSSESSEYIIYIIHGNGQNSNNKQQHQ